MPVSRATTSTLRSLLLAGLLAVGTLVAVASLPITPATPTADAISPFYKVAYGSRGFPNGVQYLVSSDGSNHEFFAAATGGGAFDWTPDGLKNVYVYSSSNGDGTYTSTMFLRNQNDDLFPVDVPDDFPTDPAISNDGERIVYTYRGAGNAYFMRVVDLEGEVLADLGEGEQPTWSPDGSKIAFTQHESYTVSCGGASSTTDGRGLAVIASGGGSSSWLVEPGIPSGDGALDSISSPDWSPDGTTIAFDARVNVREYRDGVCVQPDNTNDVDVYTVGSGGGTPTNLTEDADFVNNAYPSDPFDGNPSFSPDGSLLAFASNRNEPDNGLIHTLWVMDVGGSGQEEIYEPAGQVDSTDWTTALPEGAVVRIAASDPVATEDGETPGAVTIERTSLLNGDVDITVAVKRSSTATQGTDFPAIPTKIRIADGAATGTLVVFPTDDDAVEGDETIIIEITNGAGYLIGDPSEATITIVDNDTAGGDGDGDEPPPIASSSPGRVLDTRAAGATVDGEFEAQGRRNAGSTMVLPIAGRADVSSDASAVVMNVTAIAPESRGFVTISPCGERPVTSSLNYGEAGAVVGNEVVAKLSAEGTTCLYTSAATHLTVDVVGEVPAASPFVSLDPARLLDTRASGETVDGESVNTGRLDVGDAFELLVAGRGGVAADATAAVMNLTAINPAGRGFVTVYPCGELPLASSLNFGAAGAVVGNEVIAKLSSDGTVCIHTSTSTDFTVDVSGFVPSGTTVSSLDPIRLLDTRASGQTVDGQWEQTGSVAAGETIEVPIAGRSDVPAAAVTVVMNVTAINPTGRGFVTVYPCDELPLASSLNFGAAGAVVGNEIIAKLSPTGAVCLFSSQSADLTIDVTGYIAP